MNVSLWYQIHLVWVEIYLSFKRLNMVSVLVLFTWWTWRSRSAPTDSYKSETVLASKDTAAAAVDRANRFCSHGIFKDFGRVCHSGCGVNSAHSFSVSIFGEVTLRRALSGPWEQQSKTILQRRRRISRRTQAFRWTFIQGYLQSLQCWPLRSTWKITISSSTPLPL